MKMTITPYMKIDGIPTLRDSEVLYLYDAMVSDGVAKTIFADGHIKSREDWLNSVTSGNNLLYLVRADGSPAVTCWLNAFDGKSARMHWSVFSKFWNNGSVEAGTFALTSIINLNNHGSGILARKYLFDVLIGLVPVTNTRAIEYSKKCGGIAAAVIPNALYDWRNDKSVDAMLIHYTRKENNT